MPEVFMACRRGFMPSLCAGITRPAAQYSFISALCRPGTENNRRSCKNGGNPHMSYRKPPRRQRRGAASRWRILPRLALAIFAVTVLLLRTDAGQRLELLLQQAAQNKTLSALALFLALPGSEAPDSDTRPADEPGLSAGSSPAAESPAPEDTQAAQITLPESAAPELPAELPPSNVTSVTIDGKADGYTGSGSIYIQNRSDYDIDIPSLLKAEDGVRLSGDEVQVLIVHTHGSESYTPDPYNNYTPTDTDRTTDTRYNVVRVGDEICSVLESRGIKTLHSKTLHDSPAYSGSYDRALEDISARMKENPSIKAVIDVHRDAMITQNGTKYKTVAEVNGETTAQLMLVCGTDGGGLVHDNWKKNLSFQMKLQDRLNTEYPGLMRPINIRNERFNQHVTLGSMLLEVGTSGNSLPEALASARLFANALADELLSR